MKCGVSDMMFNHVNYDLHFLLLLGKETCTLSKSNVHIFLPAPPIHSFSVPLGVSVNLTHPSIPIPSFLPAPLTSFTPPPFLS